MRKPHILVVDGDLNSSSAIKLSLQSWAYGVSLASDAAEAMDKVEKERPDLILLEVMLPKGTEGFHFVWNLRNHPDPALRAIPIIITSDLHKNTDLRFYPHIGDPHYAPGEYLPVQAFLDKPFSVTSLAAHIQKILGSTSP